MQQINSQTIQGLRWSTLHQIVIQSLNFVIGVIFIRLLSPEDFGLIAMLTIFTGFAEILKDFGISSAVIQQKNADQQFLSSSFWLSTGLSILIALIFLIAAKPISLFFEKELLYSLGIGMSIQLLISGMGTIPNALLVKKLNFKPLFIYSLISLLAGAGVGIYLAAMDWGSWSLLYRILVQSAVFVSLLWLFSSWRPHFSYQKKEVKKIMAFATPLSGNNILNFWVRNIDDLLIGKFLGDHLLGLYNRSYSLMLMPVRRISGVFSRVLFPAFSKIQDDPKQIKKIFLKSMKMISLITFPLMFGLCALAEVFVMTLFGERWVGMIPVLQVLSILGAFQSIGTLVGDIFMSRGATKLQFKIGLITKPILILSIIFGLQYGLMGLVWCYAIASLVSGIPDFYFSGKLIGLPLKSIGQTLFPAFICSCLMVIVVIFSREQLELQLELLLLSCILIGVVAYYLILKSVFPRDYMEFNAIVKSQLFRK